MRTHPALLSITMTLFAGTAVAAGGLVPPDGRELWPRWQARIAFSASALAPLALVDLAARQRSPSQLSALLGDYYFNVPGLRLPAALGGLRATGGLMASTRGLNFGPAMPLRDGSGEPAVAYLGLGYTGHVASRSNWGGWGVTADLGMAAAGGGGTTRLGQALFGNQGFDNTSRELRLSPVLQLGVRYAF